MRIGGVAAGLGDPLTLGLAALGAVLGLAAGLRWHVADSEKQDLRPWHVSVPKLLLEPRLEEGPVMVQIEYHVTPNATEDFLRAMQDVCRMRESDGAFSCLADIICQVVFGSMSSEKGCRHPWTAGNQKLEPKNGTSITR